VRIILLTAASASIIAAVLWRVSQVEGRLLRADPETIPANAALMEFAIGRGEPQFLAHCAACHGTRGQGDPARGVPSLSDGDWLYGSGSVADIEQVVKYGIRSYHPKAWNLAIMPAYGTLHPSARDGRIAPLSPANISDVVEYLLRLQGRSADGTAAARGAALFGGGAGCYDCHAMDAKGDPAIGAPDLADGITLYGDASRAALFLSIAHGRHGVCPSWIARISAAGIREVAIFVYSLSRRGPPA
jgi:cytochrome c oxidase cbb3-type subunit 3